MRARRILMVSSEAVPFAKTGGLGDVAGALPLALARLGHDVTLVLPRYRGACTGIELERAAVPMAGRTFDVRFVEHALADRARAVLVDCPELYDRPDLYGTGSIDYPDNAVRFAVLSRAALEFASRPDRAPDVVHAHDWQAGLAPVYLETLFAARPALGRAGRVFTIHNLAYQGLFPPVWMPALDLGWDLFGVEGLEFWGKVSFLKGGINFSEWITTVSPRYAKEIQTPEFGFGFDGILRRRGKHLCGILNGIDTGVWNPERDPFLPGPTAPATWRTSARRSEALLEAMGLPVTRGRARAAARRHGVADGRSEGVRPAGRARRANCRRSTPRSSCSAAASRATRQLWQSLPTGSRTGSAVGSASTSGWRTSSRPAPTSS